MQICRRERQRQGSPLGRSVGEVRALKSTGLECAFEGLPIVSRHRCVGATWRGRVEHIQPCAVGRIRCSHDEGLVMKVGNPLVTLFVQRALESLSESQSVCVLDVEHVQLW
jgi:hypothetical protein